MLILTTFEQNDYIFGGRADQAKLDDLTWREREVLGHARTVSDRPATSYPLSGQADSGSKGEGAQEGVRSRSCDTEAPGHIVLHCVPVDRIGVRELRQNATEWIRRASAGERIEVTRHGQVMAVLVPPPAGGALAGLREAGRLKPATVTGPLPAPVRTRRSASEALVELRADER